MTSVSEEVRETMAARLQICAQFDVIENLAVEYNPERFVLVCNRLAAAAEIDDA